MARALWTGSISFGLVNIPVRLYAATESHQLDFHQFDSKTGKRVRYKRVIEGTDHEVAYDQIVDGYEFAKGKVVTLTDEELAAAEPTKSRTVDLEAFVPLDAIDPIAWNHTYYVGPDEGAGAQKAYGVLREAMKQMKRVGIGRFVMRSKQYLATLRPYGKGLALETMFFEDEIRDLEDVPGASSPAAVSARELGMAKQLIDALSGDWHHEQYKDTHRDQLLALIKQKAKGQVIDLAAPETGGGAKVIDLMEALKQSLTKGGRASKAEAKGESRANGRRAAKTVRQAPRHAARRPVTRAPKTRARPSTKKRAA